MSIQKHDLREFTGQNLTAIDIPLGAVGGSVIRMNGKAQRQWWHIFNNYEERLNTGRVPNSFFAIRTSDSNMPMVKVLQTESEGPFEAFNSLRLRSQYPFAYYDFQDSDLPVSVSMEVSSFLIPMDLKNSAIPCAIFKFMVNNNSQSKQSVSLLATQQNAVGFDGYEVHSGFENRNCSGYGSNKNIIVNNKKHTSLQMSGNAGSMQLSAYTDNVKGTSSFGNLLDLHDEFIKSGKLSGPQASQSPSEEETLVGALCKEIELKPGEEKSITFVLSWHIPKGSFGKTGSLAWDFSQAGCQYENFWSDANTVDDYVFNNFKDLYGKTRLYTDTLYESNIPGYVIDRISSNISVLKSPTSFWTKDGYYGLWESTSNNEEWLGNCKHVYHYAQAHARLFPELGRILRKQDIKSMTKEGLLPARDGDSVNALDGHCGTILSIYREHLLSENKTFLESIWGKTKEAMFYMITIHDPEETGMVSGSYHNTLDCNVSGTSPWIGSLYLAALKACSIMASLVKDTKNKDKYESIFEKGKLVQNTELWNEELGVYIEKSQALPNTLNMNKGISIDMFLGQWWSNQLGLGELYPTERICRGLLSIYKNNKFTDTDGHYEAHFRDFLGKGDTGWMMCTYPKGMPKKPVLYYDEIMSGFEYSFATTMIQYGLQKEGLHIIQEIFKR